MTNGIDGRRFEWPFEIIGASWPEQLADTLSVAGVTLDVELKAKLNELISQYRCGNAGR